MVGQSDRYNAEELHSPHWNLV